MLRRILWFFNICCCGLSAQESDQFSNSLDVQYYYGSFLVHNKNVAHLAVDQPQGAILSYNFATDGSKRWHHEYNRPDWGLSFLYVDFGNPVLGRNYGLYGHYNFYFLNRRLQLRLGQGVAYNTNPFDLDTNFKNISYGSHLLASTYLWMNYVQPEILPSLGMQAGLGFIHHSSGSVKTPNSGSNVLSFNLGVKYNLENTGETGLSAEVESNYDPISEPIRYNFVVRGGVNESDFFNLGQHPFWVISAFVDKRLSYKHTLQLGVDAFFALFLKKEIEFVSVAFPNRGITGDEDFKRFAIFGGHEFRLGHLGIVTQLGYYFYWPYEYESRVYSRAGLKYYFSDVIYGVSTVKSHAFNAEAIEFGVGIRI